MGGMTFPDAVPQRLSDAERETAVGHLRVHAAAGRLTPDELAERAGAARAARTASDLTPLFGDLPTPHPPYVDAAQPVWNTYPGATGTRAPEPGSPSAQPYPPGPVYSGTVVVPQHAPLPATQRVRWLGVAQAVIWPVTIFLVVTGAAPFYLFFVAIILSSALGGYQGNRYRRRQPPPY
jgi:Domain of unknown function (DUF1707)